MCDLPSVRIASLTLLHPLPRQTGRSGHLNVHPGPGQSGKVQTARKVCIYPAPEHSVHGTSCKPQDPLPVFLPSPAGKKWAFRSAKHQKPPGIQAPLLWTGQTLSSRGHNPNCSGLPQLPQLSKPMSFLLGKLPSVKSSRKMNLILIFLLESMHRQ